MCFNKFFIISSILLVLAGAPSIQAEFQLSGEPLSIEALPMIEKTQDGFFIGAPIINNLTVMIVRVFNNRGEPVLNIRSKGEPVELLATGLPDGEYRYQVKTIYELDTPMYEGMESESEGQRLDAGRFTIENNEILQPVSKPADEDLSFLETLTEDTLALLGKSLGMLVSNAQAADVEVSSTLPRVRFNDTTSSASCCEWWLEGEGTSTAGQFRITDLIGSNNHDVIVLKGADGVTDSRNSMVVEINGDISWGDLGMFFGKNGNNLSLGSLSHPSDIAIFDANPDIRLHDETDTSEAELELTNGIMYFKGRPDTLTSLDSIMSYDTGAPADSFKIQSNGNISWAGGDLFFNPTSQKLSIGSTLGFGNFSIADSIPAITLIEEINSNRFSLQLNNDVVQFWTKDSGGSFVDTMNMYIGAPASSFDILDSGDIRMGTGFRYHESGANSTLHIGGNTPVTQSLVLTSALPEIVLNNPGNSGVEMRMTNNIFSIGMDTNGDGSVNTQGVLNIGRISPAYSLSIENNGDINWANSSMFLDKDTKSLAIGTINTPGDFTVYDATPDIWLHDTSTTADAIFELNNNTVIFKGRSVVQNSLNNIFTYHTDAPSGSLNIFNTGDIRMGTGFRYHENGASSTLHIGGNTAVAQSLVLTSVLPEILLNNPGNSGAEMRMTNNAFSIGMDTNGDGVVNTTNVFSVDKLAPANSLRLKANGDISWSGDAMNFSSGRMLSLSNFNPGIELAFDGSDHAVYLEPAGGVMRFWTKTSGNAYSNVPLSFSLDAPVDSLTVNSTGNVGVGTGSPNEALTIERIDVGARMQLTGISSVGNEAPQMIWKRARSNVGAPAAIALNDNLGAFSFRGYDGSGFTGSRGFINVQATENWTPAANGTRMLFQTTENGTNFVRTVMQITDDGRVLVNGVALNVPDYVFEDDYELMSLDQLSVYIDENKHLPGVASAKEVNTQGLDLAGSQMSVLEKVEELTLYTLQQHEALKQVEELKAENTQLKAAHRQILANLHTQQASQEKKMAALSQQLAAQQLLVDRLIQSQESKSVYTSLK